MAFNLFKGSKAVLGVDIGTSSIKIVELGQEGGRHKLLNYGLYELHGAGGRSDSARTVMELPDEEIVSAIREMLKSSDMRSRDAVASVSSFATFATTIELPYATEEELAKAVPLEARKYVPVPLDQVVLDWSIIGPADGSPGAAVQTGAAVEVFLAAVPKDETARYQRIAKAAGLNLVALELENSSLVRAVLGNDLSPTCILNVGGRSTAIVIVAKGYERLAHNYEIGGYEITKAIASALQVNTEQAEALKRRYGLIDSPENKARAAMLSLVDMMIFETRKTVESYESAKNVRIGRIVIVGGLANMPGLTAYVKQRIDRDVLVGNVFARLVYPPELTPLVGTLSNTLAIAIGAAMRPA
jgi:type IV pilus assembly protein PilM